MIFFHLLFIAIILSQPVQAETKRDLCGIANKRLVEIHTDWSHNGFYNTDFKYYYPKYKWIGENLARGQKDLDRVYEMWENSPSHKENLDHPQIDKCIVSDTYNGVNYYVGIFAK